jgi:protein-S-isoprenylcysteine O-methyltransferase Ste14
MLFCLLGMLLLHWMLPLRAISSWKFLICGIVLIAFGLVIAFGAESQFRRNGTTIDPLGMAEKLVTDGWFRYSRNPMYLSFVIMLTGAWVTLGSIPPLLGIFMYILLTERWYILPEEKRLMATFRKQYESYQISTRRWL